jgi:hypothetical protein
MLAVLETARMRREGPVSDIRTNKREVSNLAAMDHLAFDTCNLIISDVFDTAVFIQMK